MATATFNFGKGYKNSGDDIWNIRRHLVSLPMGAAASSVFAAPNRPASSTTIELPLRTGEIIPANKIFDKVRVIIFRGFSETYTESNSSGKKWTAFYSSDRNGIIKNTRDDSEYYFTYNTVGSMALTPLAYFQSDITVTGPAQDFTYTFTNPTFTTAGLNLANWHVTTSQDDYAKNRLFVGVYRNDPSTWMNGTTEATLNWAAPWGDRASYKYDLHTVLNLKYSAGATVKYYDGSAWKDCEVYYHTGSGWQQCEVQYHNGSGWQSIG